MEENKLNEKDYSILYDGILDITKKLSASIVVEGIYFTSYMHNYHNIYGKPILCLTVITNKYDGLLENVVNDINNKYNKNVEMRITIVDHKQYENIDYTSYRATELSEAIILYDRYGIYRNMKKEAKKSYAKVYTPHVKHIESRFVANNI